MDKIVEKALSFYNTVSQIEVPQEVRPSVMWSATLNSVVMPSIRSLDSYQAVIKACTENDWCTFPLLNNDPMLEKAVENYKNWALLNGIDFNTLSHLIQESPYTSEKAIVYENGRRISSGFLWHLACCQRIQKLIPTPNTVLELGGGYGGLARIFKFANPDIKYVILDLPEMLIASYTYLAANFPHAKIILVHSSEDLKLLNSKYDFALIPTAFVNSINGFDFDLLINTQSLSEMSQTAFDRYMQLFQEDNNGKYFYNVNRYGPHPDGMSIPGRADQNNHSSDTCYCASALDSNWTLKYWNLYGDDNVGAIYPNIEVVLEILIQRIPKTLRNDDLQAIAAHSMYTEAASALKIDGSWHRLMWDAIRLNPRIEYLDLYTSVLNAKGFRQAKHFETLREKLQKYLQ
ncbi:MAG: putative sugar O-methyltransferase [Geobacteraceae bacterium]|nr:putative sugar O-methyltransferase [Geobacteraceae bacterium]NTW79390.1 putative sugar O-methyltransferase [Geobacteraceae bacterium]